jgi:hypothetical protein
MEKVLNKLLKSSFRSRFRLSAKDLDYIDQRGLEVIRSHAVDFIAKRIAPEKILNDGKQTPFKDHPVFVAQHATATCCRNCIQKWHSYPKGVAMSEIQQKYIVDLIMFWITSQYNQNAVLKR